ncbi:MAG: hypothetical protein RLZZ519_2577, partial [Bacteroidota bacterium]
SELIGQEHNSVQDEGGKQLALGGVDGALTALTAGIAKSLQLSFYAAIGMGGDAAALTSELTVGVIRGSEWSLDLMKREALIHATRGTIDGVISGAIGNVALTAADEASWRQGVWDTLSTFGVALLQGAALGGVTGGVVSGGMGAAVSKTPFNEVAKLERFAAKAGIDFDDLGNLAYERRRMVYDASSKIGAGKADEAEILIGKLRSEVGQDPATRIRKHLYVANAKPMAKPHIDAYMEQLIRIKGRVHGLLDEQWTQLEGFFHGDPACLQTFIARSDEEMLYALRIAREEADEVGASFEAHSLSRHGADVTDPKLDRRVKTGIAPDGVMSKTKTSSRFKNYRDEYEMKHTALEKIQAGRGDPAAAVDLRYPPGVNGNPSHDSYLVVIKYSSRTDLTEGFRGTGPSHAGTYATTVPLGPGINRVRTRIRWATDVNKWITVQHFPDATGFDFGLNLYSPTSILHVTL